MIANAVLTAMRQDSVAHPSYSLPSLNTSVPQILMLSSGQDTFNNASYNPSGIRILGQMSEFNPSPRPMASIVQLLDNAPTSTYVSNCAGNSVNTP
eukprot:3794979-Rhodomonas_salina.1